MQKASAAALTPTLTRTRTLTLNPNPNQVGRDGVARRNHARTAAVAASVPSSPWSNGGVLRPEKSPFLPSRSGVVRPPARRGWC